MKSFVFVVATTIVCQITASPSIRRRRGYLDRSPDHSIIISSQEDPFIHPPWWQGSSEPKPLKPNGPFGPHEAFEITHGGSGSGESSSEEELEMIRQTGPTRTPVYGPPIWWGPPGPIVSSTTERNIPSNPNENDKREQVASCIKSCPVTSEFNPVCGSNNVTYANPGRLECEQRCGIDVQLSRLTACSVPPPNQAGVEPSSNGVAACVRNCPVTAEYNPVCGSNNVTYANHGRLLCEQFCGIPVELSKLSPCISTDTNTEKPLISEEQSACMRSCPVTGEYNPVCGSNNVTYTNPGRLECAQYCGVAVTLSKKSTCGGSEPTTTTTENTLIFGFAALCMKSCPVTPEFNPVCGSNDVTYTNLGRLECAQTCGVAVTLARHTSCETPITAKENTNTTNNYAIPTTDSNVIPTSSSTALPYVNGNGDNSLNEGHNDNKNNNDRENNNLNDGNVGGNVSGGDVPDFDNNKDNNSDENGTNKGDKNFTSGNNGNNDDQEKYYNGTNNNNDDNGAIDLEDEEKLGAKGRPGGSYAGNNFPGGHGGNNGFNGNGNCKVNNRIPPTVKEVMTCMQKCSLTSESNPVCGTDSITYMNPSRLLCAQFCGIDVKVKKFAPCASTSVTNAYCPTTCTNSPVTDNPGAVTPPIPSIEACMEACPASLEFKPVCGSNNVTYRNLEKLQCARRCGIDVSLKRSTHCSAPEIIPEPKDNATLVLECIENCYVPEKYEPICGSNDVTYNNTGHLICARQCGLDVKVKQQHPCSTVTEVSPSPATSSTTEKVQVVKPGHDGLNFTIDPEILANIWGTTTPKDEDEDFELDQRVQDKQ